MTTRIASTRLPVRRWAQRAPAAARGAGRQAALHALSCPRRLTAAAIAGLLGAYAAWQLMRLGPPGDRRLIGDAFFYPMSAAALATAGWAAWSGRRWPRLRRAWTLVAASAVAYLVGDVVQTVYELAGRRPYPSAADLFYLAFYPLMLAGLLSFPTRRRTGSERLRLALDLALITVAGSGVVVYVVLGPTAVLGGPALQVACSIAYPVGDMVLLVGLSSLLLRGSPPSSRAALRLLGTGLAFYVAADLVYGYVTLHSSYEGGDAIDTLWMVAIASYAWAGLAQAPVDGPEPVVSRRQGSSWLPYLGVAVGFGLLVFSDRHDAFFPGLAMTAIAVTLAAATAARQLLIQRDLRHAERRMRHDALHDALTGLPNRALLLDRIERSLARARRAGRPPGVLFLDLDRFKGVNDTLGHSIGDELLTVVAVRLTAAVRAQDTVARLGGDEFVVLLEADGDAVEPILVAERLLALVREPVTLACGRSLTVTASIGVVSALASSAEEILRDADIALYAAKEAGKDRCAQFEATMQTVAQNRLELEMGLRRALAEDELRLLYQPTYRLRDRALTAAEALLRWEHPERGLVGADEFIGLAEETGLIVPIGKWVLEHACAQAAAWAERGYGLGVAVNVSARQLDHPGLVDDVRGALERSGLEPQRLTLEITETALTRDPETAKALVAKIKTLGVRIAIDDFGTGYSSLAHLRDFPVDALKIDRSFISGSAASRESKALVHVLVGLGKTLGMETLGEGIETLTQLQHLEEERCDLGQGLLLARPLRPEELEGLLRAEAARASSGAHRAAREPWLSVAPGVEYRA